MNTPYYLLRGGVLGNSSLDATETIGFYWSSTPYGSSSAHYLGFDSDYINAGFDYNRYFGFSVRCVAAG